MAHQVLTANRLIDGDVVYWRDGQWVEAFADADVLAGEAEAALAKAKDFVARNVVVNPYLFEVRREGSAVVPVKEREIIRAMGPSVHADLGKQATHPPPGFALVRASKLARLGGATPDKPEGADDVSI